MEMISVNSSTISQIGYEPNSASLVVEFHNGTRYTYHGVPVDVFEAFSESGSKGQFLSQVIKKGGYSYSKS